MKQKDMFVACDVLSQLFPLQDGSEKKGERTPADQMTMQETNLLLEKILQPKFLGESKYKVHKECWIASLNALILANIRKVDSK